MCPSGEHHSRRRLSSSPSRGCRSGCPFLLWVFVVRALLKTGIWRVEVGVCLELEGSHLRGRMMCGLRAGAEILSTCFEHFRRDLFSTPNYLPELFDGAPISAGCFLSFPIRRGKGTRGPRLTFSHSLKQKFHTVNGLLWFSKKQAVSALGRRGWNCRSKGSLGLSESLGEQPNSPSLMKLSESLLSN